MAHLEPTDVFADRPVARPPSAVRQGEVHAFHYGPSLEARLRRYWPHLLVFALFSSSFVFAMRWWKPVRYASTVVLLVEDQNRPAQVGPAAKEPAPGIMYAYHLATSTAVLDHLIESFDLGAHYGTNISDPMGHAATVQALLDAIQTHNPDEQCLAVTVLDTDRELAAAMANAIGERLVALSERNKEEKLERSVTLYANILERAQVRNKEQRDQLTGSVAAELAALQGRQMSSSDKMELQRTLDLLHASYGATDELHRSLDFSTELLDQPGPPSIMASRAAMLDTAPSKEVLALRAGLWTFPTALLVALGVLILLHFHGQEVVAMWRAPSVKPHPRA